MIEPSDNDNSDIEDYVSKADFEASWNQRCQAHTGTPVLPEAAPQQALPTPVVGKPPIKLELVPSIPLAPDNSHRICKFSDHEFIQINPSIWPADSSVWLIEGFLERGRFIGIIGPPKQGKTLVVQDFLLHALFGMQWAGRLTTKIVVLIYPGESAKDLQNRFRVWCKRHGKLDVPFTDIAYFIKKGPAVKMDGDVTKLLIWFIMVPLNKA